jgi:hypothetical protein
MHLDGQRLQQPDYFRDKIHVLFHDYRVGYDSLREFIF